MRQAWDGGYAASGADGPLGHLPQLLQFAMDSGEIQNGFAAAIVTKAWICDFSGAFPQ
jgi:hypothetical protein